MLPICFKNLWFHARFSCMASFYVINYVASFCMVKKLVYINIDFKKQFIVSCYNCSMQVLEDIFYLTTVKRK